MNSSLRLFVSSTVGVLSCYSVIMTAVTLQLLKRSDDLAPAVCAAAHSDLTVCETQLDEASANLKLLEDNERQMRDELAALTKTTHSALCLAYWRSEPEQRLQLTVAFQHEHCKVEVDHTKALSWHEP